MRWNLTELSFSPVYEEHCTANENILPRNAAIFDPRWAPFSFIRYMIENLCPQHMTHPIA